MLPVRVLLTEAIVNFIGQIVHQECNKKINTAYRIKKTHHSRFVQCSGLYELFLETGSDLGFLLFLETAEGKEESADLVPKGFTLMKIIMHISNSTNA